MTQGTTPANTLGISRPQSSPWEQEHAGTLRRLTFLLLGVGVAWRLFQYLLCWPIWHDEAMLLVNYVNRSFLDLLGPIENIQIAPLLFQVTEWALVQAGWHSELILRLPALLAGLAALVLFYRLAGMVLTPAGRCLAVGILAVSVAPVELASQVKPYAWDLLLAVVYLLLAVSWLQRPRESRALVHLVWLTPLAVLASYPVVFVAGAVSLALAPLVWRQGARRDRWLFILFNLLLVGVFLAHYLLVALPHLASRTGGTTTSAGMHDFWKNAFPPAHPLRFVGWLIRSHLAEMSGYPIGGGGMGSIGTFVLVLLGAWQLSRRGQWRLLLLMGNVFLIWLVAAALRKYPYGGALRTSQHAAPILCLLAGAGAAVLIEWGAGVRRGLEPGRARLFGCRLVAVGLVLFACTRMVFEAVHPSHRYHAFWARQVTGELLRCAQDEAIVLPQAVGDLEPFEFRWYLGRLGRRIESIGGPAKGEACPGGSSVWVVVIGPAPMDERTQLQALLESRGGLWQCAERSTRIMCAPRSPRSAFHFCRIYHFRCPNSEQSAPHSQVSSARQ